MKRDLKKGVELGESLFSKSIAAQCTAHDSLYTLFQEYEKHYIPFASLLYLIYEGNKHDLSILQSRASSSSDDIKHVAKVFSEESGDIKFYESICEALKEGNVYPTVGEKIHDTLGEMIKALQAINLAYRSGLFSFSDPSYSEKANKQGFYT